MPHREGGKRMRSDKIPAQNRRWYRLDNAAKIYPAIKNSNWNSLFRLSARLKETVDPAVLQRALDRTVARFECFRFRMHKGVFWYYLEENPGRPLIEEDVENPLIRMNFKKNNYFLFRVRYFGRTVALELFHVVTDGTGALIFLKTLIAEYLRQTGVDVPPGHGVLDLDGAPDPEEMEDSYRRYSNLNKVKSRRESRAWHVQGRDLPAHRLILTTGEIPASALVRLVKERGVSVTEYLTAVYIRALYKLQRRQGKNRRPIKISVPVNMRTFYPSKTLRNFALYINVGIDPEYGEYSFDEILTNVHNYMRYELNAKFLNAQMAANVSSERSMLLRPVPLFLKNAGLQLAFNFWGEGKFTTSYSNLGVVDVPDEMRPHIERFDFLLGSPKNNKINMASITFEDKLAVNFSRTILDPAVEREFFTFLVRQGIPVKLESNQR